MRRLEEIRRIFEKERCVFGSCGRGKQKIEEFIKNMKNFNEFVKDGKINNAAVRKLEVREEFFILG